MAFLGIGGKPSFVATQEITDSTLRAAAELIDEHVGRQGDHRVTAQDLGAAERLLAKHRVLVAAGKGEASPLARLRPAEVDLLEHALPRLPGLLHDGRAKPRKPFATSMPYLAIGKPDIRECGRLVAECFGSHTDKSDPELNLTELAEAKQALADLTAGTLQQTNPQLAARLLESGVFTAANLGEIELFMTTGKGGLLSYGPMTVGGQTFTEVYRIDDREVMFRTGAKGYKGGESAERPAKEAALSHDAVIDQVENMLPHCAYDRIYVRGYDGGLYVALHERGAIDKIEPGFRAQLEGPYHCYQDAGAVVRVVDINNSLKESTLGFWSKILDGAVGMIRSKLLARLDRRVASATDEASLAAEKGAEELKELKQKVTALDAKALLAAGVGVSSFGLAIFNLPVAIGVASGTGLAITASNFYDWLRRDKDRAAIYNAIGVAVEDAGGPVIY